eukprot:3583590-Lingulodinium_polyedra.AAC.1
MSPGDRGKLQWTHPGGAENTNDLASGSPTRAVGKTFSLRMRRRGRMRMREGGGRTGMASAGNTAR